MSDTYKKYLDWSDLYEDVEQELESCDYIDDFKDDIVLEDMVTCDEYIIDSTNMQRTQEAVVFLTHEICPSCKIGNMIYTSINPHGYLHICDKCNSQHYYREVSPKITYRLLNP